MSRFQALQAAFLVGCFATAAAALSPEETARAYIEALKDGKAETAAPFYWDANRTLQNAFGLTYIQLQPEDRLRSQRAFWKFLSTPFSNPGVARLFRTTVIVSATPAMLSPDLAMVKLKVIGNGGKHRVENTLLLRQTPKGWKLVDQQQNDQMSIRVAMGVTYATEQKSATDTLPDVLERLVGQLEKDVRAAK